MYAMVGGEEVAAILRWLDRCYRVLPVDVLRSAPRSALDELAPFAALPVQERTSPVCAYQEATIG